MSLLCRAHAPTPAYLLLRLTLPVMAALLSLADGAEVGQDQTGADCPRLTAHHQLRLSLQGEVNEALRGAVPARRFHQGPSGKGK